MAKSRKSKKAPWPVFGTLAGLSMFSSRRGSPKE
jgi:hypothetical protein